MGRPKGSRTKLSGAGLMDLLPLAKIRIKDALENGTRSEAMEAVKIVTKYSLIEGHSVNHTHESLTEEFISGIYGRNFPQAGEQASAVN